MGPLIVALLSRLIPFPSEEDALRVLIGLARGLDIPRDWHLVDGGGIREAAFYTSMQQVNHKVGENVMKTFTSTFRKKQDKSGTLGNSR